MSMTYDECAEQDYWNRHWDRVCRGCPEAGNDEWCAGCRKDMRNEEDEDDEQED